METEYKYIKIIEIGKSKSGKTFVFAVINKIYQEELGIIKWIPSYRKYGFYPTEETFYEEECLKNISDFLIKLKEVRNSSQD